MRRSWSKVPRAEKELSPLVLPRKRFAKMELPKEESTTEIKKAKKVIKKSKKAAPHSKSYQTAFATLDRSKQYKLPDA